MSPKPFVIANRVLSPFRSNKALVATVVPIFIRSILSIGIWSLDFKDNMSRIPCMAASEYCCGFSDSSLCVEILPSGLRPIISVKVPPLSIQNCHLL